MNTIGRGVFIILMAVGIIASLKIVSDPECFIKEADPCEECQVRGFLCANPYPYPYNQHDNLTLNETEDEEDVFYFNLSMEEMSNGTFAQIMKEVYENG